jgi:hypothetical protein
VEQTNPEGTAVLSLSKGEEICKELKKEAKPLAQF